MTSCAALTASSQSYTITVGDGGAGSFNPGSYGGMPNATRGGDSSFDSLLTALGGGFAGSWSQDTRSNEGGSGGGRNSNRASRTGLQPSQPGDSGIYGFGNDGALCAVPGTSNYPGGGGGGAGEQPPDAPNQNTSGRGGDGMDMSDYFGTLYGENGYFAGGGEGGAWGNVTLTNGGLGGGGDGDCPNSGSNGGSKNLGAEMAAAASYWCDTNYNRSEC